MPVHLFPAKVEALDETSPFLRVVRLEPNPEQFPFGFEEPLSEFFPVNGSSRQSRHSCYRKRQTTHDRQKAKRRMKCEYWSFLRSLSTSADLLESECKGMYWAAPLTSPGSPPTSPIPRLRRLDVRQHCTWSRWSVARPTTIHL